MATSTSNRPQAAGAGRKTRAAPNVAAQTTATEETDANETAEARLDTAVAATLDPALKPAHQRRALRKRELIDLVVTRSGMKKKDAKPVVEAALAVLGEQLADGRELNLAPLGKVRVTKHKQATNGQVLTARIRQPDPSGRRPADEAADGSDEDGSDPLAPAAE
ncbi:integration host factor subunit alpha [Roseivivax jejudonensis]|uniref:Integration host factor subunit alpha n=1 Tax=Roseivivax jejudonensis TaxID=1529041 RepID=A0A1X6Z8E6_9RHOB|nr:HU family DNA-binding protein [Roseivivax jejudonensis]SLN43760.1 integration host factor subunit alpha [Roseivivax jejudonensis]